MDLKKLRKAHGYTQAELARKLECSVTSVYMWEHELAVPTQRYRAKLAELFGIDGVSTAKTRIQRMREKRGMNYIELSRRSHCARMSIYYWETGQSKPSLRSLRKLALALDCDVHELME